MSVFEPLQSCPGCGGPIAEMQITIGALEHPACGWRATEVRASDPVADATLLLGAPDDFATERAEAFGRILGWAVEHGLSHDAASRLARSLGLLAPVTP